jgi:hypothetical protein
MTKEKKNTKKRILRKLSPVIENADNIILSIAIALLFLLSTILYQCIYEN